MTDLTELEQAQHDETQIRDLLDILAELQEARDAAIAPLVARRKALEAQIAEAAAEFDAQIEALRKAIRQAIVAHGDSVQTERIRATFVQPRVTWDTKRLDGYAEAHPEIKAFRRVGKPSVRLTLIE